MYWLYYYNTACTYHFWPIISYHMRTVKVMRATLTWKNKSNKISMLVYLCNRRATFQKYIRSKTHTQVLRIKIIIIVPWISWDFPGTDNGLRKRLMRQPKNTSSLREEKNMEGKKQGEIMRYVWGSFMRSLESKHGIFNYKRFFEWL